LGSEWVPQKAPLGLEYNRPDLKATALITKQVQVGISLQD
jgi:hypothetical protein